MKTNFRRLLPILGLILLSVSGCRKTTTTGDSELIQDTRTFAEQNIFAKSSIYKESNLSILWENAVPDPGNSAKVIVPVYFNRRATDTLVCGKRFLILDKSDINNCRMVEFGGVYGTHTGNEYEQLFKKHTGALREYDLFKGLAVVNSMKKGLVYSSVSLKDKNGISRPSVISANTKTAARWQRDTPEFCYINPYSVTLGTGEYIAAIFECQDLLFFNPLSEICDWESEVGFIPEHERTNLYAVIVDDFNQVSGYLAVCSSWRLALEVPEGYTSHFLALLDKQWTANLISIAAQWASLSTASVTYWVTRGNHGQVVFDTYGFPTSAPHVVGKYDENDILHLDPAKFQGSEGIEMAMALCLNWISIPAGGTPPSVTHIGYFENQDWYIHYNPITREFTVNNTP